MMPTSAPPRNKRTELQSYLGVLDTDSKHRHHPLLCTVQADKLSQKPRLPFIFQATVPSTLNFPSFSG